MSLVPKAGPSPRTFASPTNGPGPGASRIAAVTFYGYEFTEYIAMLEVVSSRFAIDWTDVPEEIRGHLARKA